MKTLIALALVVASLAHAEDEKVKIGQACLDTVKQSAEKLKAIEAEMEIVKSLKDNVVAKRSVLHAKKLGCPEIYFQNLITYLRDGILDDRRLLDPALAEIEKVSGQWYVVFLKDRVVADYKDIKKMIFEGRGPGPALAFTRSGYIGLYSQRVEELKKRVSSRRTEIAEAKVESVLVKEASLESLTQNVKTAEDQLDRELTKARSMLYAQRNFVQGDRTCSKNELAQLVRDDWDRRYAGGDWEPGKMDAEYAQNLLDQIGKVDELGIVAKDRETNECRTRESYYSGRNAVFIKDLTAEN